MLHIMKKILNTSLTVLFALLFNPDKATPAQNKRCTNGINSKFSMMTSVGLILLAVLCLPLQAVYAGLNHDTDGDLVIHGEEECNAFYSFSTNRGTCDSIEECDAHRSCVLTNNQSCDINGHPGSIITVTPFPATPFCVVSGATVCAYCQLTEDFDCDGTSDNLEVFTDATDPADPNASQDTDGDRVGLGCDNCPTDANWDQANLDGDALGDVCDGDRDGDGKANGIDMCPDGPAINWTRDTTLTGNDIDDDGCRDADEDSCVDRDGDGYGTTGFAITGCGGSTTVFDNCPVVSNPFQVDTNADGEGDACDPDMDGDMLLNAADACPLNQSMTPGVGNGYDAGCDQICMRPNIGVPGQPQPRIPIIDGAVADDVGWRGAHRVTFNNGSSLPHVAFQGLRDKRGDATPANAFFYMSFEVKNDTGGASAGDTVVITFRPSFNIVATSFPAGNVPNDIRIIIDAATGNEQVAIHNGTLWNNVASPSGMSVIMNPTPDTDAWDVEIAMPITTAAGGSGWFDFGNYFKFYFNVIRETSPINIEFVWPDRGHRIGGDVNTYEYDNHEWGIGTKDNAAVCHGVYLEWSDIGNELGASVSEINLTNPNRFFANVKNLTWDSSLGASGDWAAANDINVRFRIADWGMAGVGDNPSWRQIPGTAPTAGCTGMDRNPSCNNNVAAATSAIAPGDQAFKLDWTLSLADQDLYDPAATPVAGYDHQCILVELSSNSNANISTRSVHRNMDIDLSASVFQRKAKISAVGLGKPASGKTEHQFILQESRHEFEPVPIEKREQTVFAAAGLKNVKGRQPDDRSGGIWGSVSTTRWLIHGYRETGNFVEIEGVKYPLSEPVSSFGYVVSHEGAAAEGWDYELAVLDAGSGLEKLADGVYRLAVPEDGFRVINTRVKPNISLLGQILEFLFEYWWLLLILLIILILLWWKRNNP